MESDSINPQSPVKSSAPLFGRRHIQVVTKQKRHWATKNNSRLCKVKLSCV